MNKNLHFIQGKESQDSLWPLKPGAQCMF